MFMLNQSGAKWTTKRKARKFGQKRHLSVGDEKGRDGWQMNLVRSKSESKNYKAILAKKQKWSWIKPFLTLCLIFSVLGILGYYFYQNYGSIIAREKLRTENMENLKARYFINAYNYNVRLGKSHLASKNYDWAVYYFELALNSQDGDEELFNNLIFACEKTCENENINCEEVNYYKNILTEFNNQ